MAEGDYPVPGDKWLAEKLVAIERRLAELEGARSMRSTTLTGGTFALKNTAAETILSFAQFGNDPEGNPVFGVVGLDQKGDIVLMWADDRDGMVYPHEYHQWIVPTPQTITSGTFVGVAECDLVLVNEDVLTAAGAVICAVGTTAEVRLNWAGQFTDPVVCPDGFNGVVMFEWLHPFTVGWGDSTSALQSGLCHWEVRRASGAGNVTAYPPRHLTMRSRAFSSLANTNGGGRFA